MELRCDLHMHTALSPCAVEDMSPNNIVNMSLIMSLDVIAITDHNACENAEVIMKVARDTGLIVIPGMEVETMEEIHMVCLFKTLEQAMALQDKVYDHLPPRRNNARIFGEQLLMNEKDEEIGRNERLLSFSTAISVDDLVPMVTGMGGLCIPAHIDRPSYSIIANLGMLPEHLSLPVLEISRFATLKDYQKKYPNHKVIQASDAHDLETIGAGAFNLAVKEKSIHGVFEALGQQ